MAALIKTLRRTFTKARSDPYASLTPFELQQDEEDSKTGLTDHIDDDTDISKSERIQRCIERSDLKGLRKLGRERDGFISDDLRKKAWPLVAKVDLNESIIELTEERLANFEAYQKKSEDDYEYYRYEYKNINLYGEKFENHRLYRVIRSDDSRTYLYRFEESDQRPYYCNQLRRIGMQLFLNIPGLVYHDGYLCPCAVFLNVLDEKMVFRVMKSITERYWRKYLINCPDDLLIRYHKAEFEMILLIVGVEKPNLRKFLEAAETRLVDTYTFIWCASRIKNFAIIARLFDLFMTSDPVMTKYFLLAIILHFENDILSLQIAPGFVEAFLKLEIWEREEEIPVEDLIHKARCLLLKYPPESLPKYQPLDPEELERIRIENSKRSFPPHPGYLKQVIHKIKPLESIDDQIDSIDSIIDRRRSSVLDNQSGGSKKPTTEDKKVSEDSAKEELFQIKPKSAPSTTKPGIASTNIPDSKSQAVTSGKPTVPVTAAREEPRISRREQIPQIGKRRAPSSIRRSDPLGHSIEEALLIAIGVLILAYLYYILFSD